MSGFARAKRVTDPLDDKAKARLIGCQLRCSSSGSEHSADHDDSPCLSGLVHGFLEEEDSDFAHESSNGHGSDSERVDLVIDCTDFVEDMIRSSSNDSYRNLLFFHVSKAMERFSCLRNQRPVLRRKVMSFLRELGHNAAICKTKWESSGGGLAAGSYEFIDVVLQLKSPSLQSRYVVDLDFASQFEIARPTSPYMKLLHHLPRVFVGKSEDLKTIVKSISDAARRSLKTGELYLPPWRQKPLHAETSGSVRTSALSIPYLQTPSHRHRRSTM
ncbi:IMPORT ATP-BINDING PROTEIN putative (DUF506)-RELATED [Salix koriyanagi]|uniref:IMPORT ATP-BINDING PROTEIN putative (DUF506)-RELATED n=1 Tax=Salix koriyanagi TaxID=2511006 RepID=A0A9Q0V098_9ROSI|nr:IMPORT ATP-BINDING PROTEIN putative (DUF506)-RELATED [Salix koriyanagi]